MSLLTKGIGAAKKVKHHFQDEIKRRTPVYISPVRRIERVKTSERICAMTFDDGPCRLPASPGGDRPLTLSLIDTLEKHGAKGTFDVVGDTSTNYPDVAGKHGSASWGGEKYDHYPDINKDSDGGAANCPELIERILSGGHEITSHTYAHILYGWKPLVYGRRKFLGDIELVLSDLEKLHSLMLSKYNYEIKLSRPPHYVDRISNHLTSYDAYACMGYQYMAASFDGAGWLPLSSYQAEVEATWKPMERALDIDPDFFCGQIIFQKDGYNMARRTPIADGLEKQLELLDRYGYRVVTVSDLLKQSPFADCANGDPAYPYAKKLLETGFCPAFRDNTIRVEKPVTRGELAMIMFGTQAANDRISIIKSGEKSHFRDISTSHPYYAAIKLAIKANCFTVDRVFRPDVPITSKEFIFFCGSMFAKSPKNIPYSLSRVDVLKILADYI